MSTVGKLIVILLILYAMYYAGFPNFENNSKNNGKYTSDDVNQWFNGGSVSTGYDRDLAQGETQPPLDYFKLYNNQACTGMDEIGSWFGDTINIEECAQICLNDPECVSFEYKDFSNPPAFAEGTGKCNVSKSCAEGSQSVLQQGFKLYIRNDTPLSNFTGVRRRTCGDTNNLGELTNATLSQCMAECWANPNCFTVDYEPTKNKCSFSNVCTQSVIEGSFNNVIYIRKL